MNKTLETQNSKGLSGTINPVPGDLLIYIYDAEYFLIEDMPLYLVIDKNFVKGTSGNLKWCNKDKDMHCFSLICNNRSHISQMFEACAEVEDNKDPVLKFYVRLSDLLPLND